MAGYAGNHWYKCDLHLHTMSSDCYLEKNDTPEMWVDRAVEQGLNVLAVTDHNDYRGISPICEAAKDKGLVVFPGVEITCDSSKIHMVILFDVGKSSETVRDFLNRCDIDSELVGSSVGTSLSVFEVCTIAKKRGALVIAAHIDEFNAISTMNPANLDKLLGSRLIDAYQVTNQAVWEQYAKDKDAAAMEEKLKEKYGPDINSELINSWRKCYNRVKESHLPMIESSDNPHSAGESKHGLWGIGSDYTWIEMGDKVNLESLQQALITPESRIRLSSECPSKPKAEPDFWINSIHIRNTALNPHRPISLNFHPELNCIIGRRGSGKSTIVRILSGVYKQLQDGLLTDSIAEERLFYKQTDEDGQGVFHEDSEIEIVYQWYGTPCRFVITDIKDVDHQSYHFYYTDPETGEEVSEEISESGFKALVSAQVYTQKEISEIVMRPGAILELVDKAIPDMYLLKHGRDYLFEHMLLLSKEIHAVERLMAQEERVRAEKNWLDSLKENEDASGINQDTVDAMSSLRGGILDKMASYKERLSGLEEELKQCKVRYEETLEQIRKARRDLVAYAMRDDENYKIELAPASSRASFERMIKKILNVNLDPIRSDVLLLEDHLFEEKKGGHEAYEKLLRELRAGSKTDFTEYFQHCICNLSETDFERLLIFCPEDQFAIYYHPNGVKRFFPMTKASAGEKAAAVLSFLLGVSDAPLIIDQPEDDLDSSIIYEELIPKIRRAKNNRQMIFVTHNAIITTNADAEMVISMDHKSEFMRTKMSGSMDDPEIRKEICEALEGTEEAFRKRARKYNFG